MSNLSKDPLSVKYFGKTVHGIAYFINDDIYPVYEYNLDEKIAPTEITEKGKFHKFYDFKDM